MVEVTDSTATADLQLDIETLQQNRNGDRKSITANKNFASMQETLSGLQKSLTEFIATVQPAAKDPLASLTNMNITPPPPRPQYHPWSMLLLVLFYGLCSFA